MKHNITGRGYGIQHEVRVTERVRASFTKPTGLNAVLSPPVLSMFYADQERDFQEHVETRLADVPNENRESGPERVARMNREAVAAEVAYWVDMLRTAQHDRFQSILENHVPARLRAAVVAESAR